jgi:hypothetical protein
MVFSSSVFICFDLHYFDLGFGLSSFRLRLHAGSRCCPAKLRPRFDNLNETLVSLSDYQSFGQ